MDVSSYINAVMKKVHCVRVKSTVFYKDQRRLVIRSEVWVRADLLCCDSKWLKRPKGDSHPHPLIKVQPTLCLTVRAN